MILLSSTSNIVGAYWRSEDVAGIGFVSLGEGGCCSSAVSVCDAGRSWMEVRRFVMLERSRLLVGAEVAFGLCSGEDIGKGNSACFSE